MPNFQMGTEEKRVRNPTLLEGVTIHFTHCSYQLIYYSDCKLIISDGCLLFNGQKSLPERPSDSLGIDTGGFHNRDTGVPPDGPLQKARNAQNAINNIIWDWFCHFWWHPFLWIGLLFLTSSWAPCRNKVSASKQEVFLILYGTLKKYEQIFL